MKTTTMLKSVVVAALLASGGAFAAPTTNLIQNGSFEADTQGIYTWNIYPGLTDWTTGANSIELRNNVVGTAAQGVNFVELDTYANSSISQSIQTVVNQSYTLTFQLSNRDGVDLSSQGLDVSWGGTAVATNLNSSLGNSGWQTVSYTLLGDGTAKSLTFAAAALSKSDGLGTSLDNVSLTAAVPEPETYGMMLAGLGLLGFVARRRKAAVAK